MLKLFNDLSNADLSQNSFEVFKRRRIGVQNLLHHYLCIALSKKTTTQKWNDQSHKVLLERKVIIILVLGPYIRTYTSEHIVTLADTDAAASRLQLCTIIRTVGDGIFHPLSFIQITHLYTLLFVLLIFIHIHTIDIEKPHTSAYVYSFTHIYQYINTEIHTRNPIRKK